MNEIIIECENRKVIETEIMRAINKSLYHKGVISLEIFEKASEIILRGENNGFI